MNSLPTTLLFSNDSFWEQRLKGYLYSIADVVTTADETELRLLLHQRNHGILFLDLYGTHAVALLQEFQGAFPDLQVVALGDARSDPGMAALSMGICDILPKDVDRLRLQNLYRILHQRSRLLMEVQALREQLQRPPEPVAVQHERSVFADFHHLSRAFRRFDNFALMLDGLVEAISHLTHVARVGIVAVNHDGIYRYAVGRNALPVTQSRAYARDHALVMWLRVNAHCISRKRLQHIDTVSERMLLADELDAHGVDLILPLFGRECLIGWLLLGRPASGAPFQDQDVTDLTHMAEQISIAIENAILHDSLAVEKALAENLLQTIPNGIIAVSPDGSVRWLNEVAKQFLHLEHDSRTELSLSHFPALLADMMRRCLDGDQQIGPKEWEAPTGKRPLLLQAHRLEQHGECMGAMMLLQDLADEHLLREKQNNVERAAFWNELANALSHEVRNPLVAISTFAQLLPESYQDESFRSQFRDLTTQEVSRLNNIVDQLDLFANPPPLSLEPVTIDSLVHAGICEEPETSGEKPIVTLDIPANLPLVHADANLFALALSHLLNNARNAVASASVPRIQVRAYLQEEPRHKHRIVLEVIDNGKGIPAKDLDKVYSPFFTTKTRGVGLGLAIVRRTMIDHGGTVDIVSDSGGTTVRLALPVWEESRGEVY